MAKDNFSKQSELYRKFRPNYPSDLLEEILNLTKNKDFLWDVGTGNGQVAVALAAGFKKVFATDISAKQIENAVPKDNIIYSLQKAEITDFEPNTFDLITVAQAVHWFDFEDFYKEVQRVGKKEGILAIWGYGLLQISPDIDILITDFYTNTIGSYWDAERKHIDNAYESIPFPFKNIPLKKNYFIENEWTIEALEGYLYTWSSVQKYLDKHPESPIDSLMEAIRPYWKDGAKMPVRFPIFTKIARL